MKRLLVLVAFLLCCFLLLPVFGEKMPEAVFANPSGQSFRDGSCVCEYS